MKRFLPCKYFDDTGELKEGFIIRETPVLYYYICPEGKWKQQDIVRRLKQDVIHLTIVTI
jgi:hypothetical protein